MLFWRKKNSVPKKLPLGLALSGGGARGFAHLGVIKALEERGMRPNIVAGVSAGSIAAVMYSAGIAYEDIFAFFESGSFTKFAEFGIPKDGFFSLQPFMDKLRQILPVQNIEELRIPTVICATDIDHGTTKIFSSGSIVERVAASCCIPIVFKPIKIDGINYVDGGVLRNLPAWAIRSRCEKLIGVNCSPLTSYKFKNNIIDIAQRSYGLMSKVNTVVDTKMCDILIVTREAASHKSLDLSGIRQIFKSGYEDACRLLDSNVKSDINEFIKSNVLQ